jgi:hypothetical protein
MKYIRFYLLLIISTCIQIKGMDNFSQHSSEKHSMNMEKSFNNFMKEPLEKFIHTPENKSPQNVEKPKGVLKASKFKVNSPYSPVEKTNHITFASEVEEGVFCPEVEEGVFCPEVEEKNAIVLKGHDGKKCQLKNTFISSRKIKSNVPSESEIVIEKESRTSEISTYLENYETGEEEVSNSKNLAVGGISTIASLLAVAVFNTNSNSRNKSPSKK